MVDKKRVLYHSKKGKVVYQLRPTKHIMGSKVVMRSMKRWETLAQEDLKMFMQKVYQLPASDRKLIIEDVRNKFEKLFDGKEKEITDMLRKKDEENKNTSTSKS